MTASEATPGTLLECVKDIIQPGAIRIYKYQQVRKLRGFDSGMIAVETLHNARMAVVDPECFRLAQPAPQSKKREWKTSK
jgi:hypothetical protein